MEEKIITGSDQLSSIKASDNVYISHWIDDVIQLDRIARIVYLRIGARDRKGLSYQTNLKHLNIMYLSEKEGIEKLINLEELIITYGNIGSLNFLEYMPKLRKLNLAYLYNLRDVSGLSTLSKSLEYLEIISCKNIDWKNELESLPGLRKLIFRSKFNLDEINWVEKMPQLEHLALGDTIIGNGDFKPAKDIRFVSMDNKKHYNYRYDHETMKIVPK